MPKDRTQRRRDDCQEELSEENSEYIEARKETLRSKCRQINSCIDVLLEDENLLVVLKGYNLSLNKTCSLVYKNTFETNGNFSSGKCSSEDRKHIHTAVEQDIIRHIEGKRTGWNSVKKCLNNNYGDADESTYVEKICGLAYNRTQICRNFTNVHSTVEDYVNGQIHNLKCSCRNLQNEDSKIITPGLIAAAVGGGVFLLFVLVLSYICYRRRKSRRKNQTPNVIYVQAPNNDNYPVYQEVFDDKAYKGYKQSPSTNPPTLPMRYTTPLSKMSDRFDEQGYLEPATVSTRSRPRLPIPGTENRGYGTPPEYSEKDVMDEGNTENGYFEPQLSPTVDEDIGYDTLEKNKPGLEKTKPTYNTQDEPKAESVPLGPVPAKRTKKEDRKTESHYFILDTEDNNRTENSSV